MFVDGHASITWYPVEIGATPHRTGVWQIDPSGPDGWGNGIARLDGRAVNSVMLASPVRLIP